MKESHKSPGLVVDELIVNPRRLALVHICLGVISAGIYWMRPGTFTPHLPIYQIRDSRPVVLTLISWFPYVISFLVSRHLLEGRSQVSVIVFGILATIITAFSAAFYLDWITNSLALSSIHISVAVTAALIGAAYLCAGVWRRDTSD